MKPQDGQLLYVLGVEFEVEVDYDDEGHAGAWATCQVCDRFVRLSDDALFNHASHGCPGEEAA